MRDYKLLAEGLRYCSKHICNKECGYYEICHRERQDKYPSNINVGFDAADAIEEMLDELTTIRKQFPRWISVEERLPKTRPSILGQKSSKVIVAFQFDDGMQGTDTAHILNGDWAFEDRITVVNRTVTHWMPLPSPPKGEEKP